jgi:hypothetical protein
MYKTALPLKIFKLRLFVLPVRVTRRWIRVWSNGRMIVEGGNLSTRIKKLSQCNFVHQTSCTAIEFRTPRWKAGERQLSDGTAMKPEIDLQIIWPVSTSEKTHCFHTAKTEWLWMLKWVPGVPAIVRTTQNTLLCEMRGPAFQHLACTATTVGLRGLF